MVKPALVEANALSVTVIVKVAEPLAGADPVKTPEPLTDAHAGRPDADQLKGGVPPAVPSGKLKPVFRRAVHAVVVIDGGALISRLYERLALIVGVASSVTVTLTVNEPVKAGVPEITPEPALMDMPEGRPVADQE
jgi:hypothetical protein